MQYHRQRGSVCTVVRPIHNVSGQGYYIDCAVELHL